MAAKVKKILIVDDEYFLAEVIKARLESLGYEAQIAENGQEALTFLRKEKVDLILLDVMMPVMDGWATARKIRDDPRLKPIPIIFLTALSRHEDHLKAHDAGASDFISKPFETEDLVAKVKKWILI